MRKTVLIASFLMLFTNAFSQKKLTVEFSGGPTISTFQGSSERSFSSSESKPAIGFFLQSNLNYRANDLISLDFGLGYDLNRFSIDEENSARVDLFRKTSDLVLPLGINFHLGEKKRFSLGSGIAVNILLSAKELFKLDLSRLNVFSSNDDELFQNNSNDIEELDVEEEYTDVSFEIFLKAKQRITLNSKLDGFISLQLSQNLNRFEEIAFTSRNGDQTSVTRQTEAPIINIGFGIQL